MNNSMNIEDAYYKFNITSENENDLFPISGELYIKKDKYFIDSEEIDQIFDGNKLYTIIHENQEIIITSDSNTFFNFTPKQVYNFFKDDFEIEIEESQDISYNLIARNLINKDLFYKIIICSRNSNDRLLINCIDLKIKATGSLSQYILKTTKINKCLGKVTNCTAIISRFNIKISEDFLYIELYLFIIKASR